MILLLKLFQNLWVKKDKTSLKWLTVAIPLVDTGERLERDSAAMRDQKWTRERLSRYQRETSERLARD